MTETSLQADYHLRTSEHGDAVVVRFGKCHILDEYVANALGLELYGVADRPHVRRLILDFCGVAGMCSLMLGKLLMLRSEMVAKGGGLVLCGLAPDLKRLFSLTRLDQVFDIEGSAVDALQAPG